jgi:hypothetical protein
MRAQAAAALKERNPKAPPQRRKPSINQSQPLKNAKRELFSQHVANGMKVTEAYKLVGFGGGDRARWEVRNAPEVMARIEWLLNDRVQRHSAREFRPEKKETDLRLRVLKRLERIAFGDVRGVATWDRKAKLSTKCDVVGIFDELTIMPSHKLTHDAAATVKSVFTKSGELRVELHDPQPALEKLCKALGIYADAAPPPAPTNSLTLNIGGEAAIEHVRRVAFLLAAAENSASTLAAQDLRTIEGVRIDTPEPTPAAGQAQSEKQ